MSTSEVEEDEEITHVIPKNAYPCPTCGMLFGEPDMCDAHAVFCLHGKVEEIEEIKIEWTEDRQNFLIDCLDSRYDKFVHMSGRERKNHWKRVAQVVGTTPDEARHRWNQLTASYNRIKIALAQGRGMSTVNERWKYFDKIDNILGTRTTARPEFVISSMPIEPSGDGSVQPVSGILMSPDDPLEVGSNAKLIDIMEERYPKFVKMLPRKRKEMWEEVGRLMAMSANEARIRWNMLVGSYKRIKFNRMVKTGRSPINRQPWQHYEQMDRMLGDKFSPVMPLLVLSSPRTLAPNPMATVVKPQMAANIAGTPLKSALLTGATVVSGATMVPGATIVSGATVAPRPAGVLPPNTTVLQFGPNGVLQPATTLLQTGAAVGTGVPTVLQQPDGRPMEPLHAAAEVESFANKRKALFVEEYLRGKARREDLRLQLEERRVRALERLADAMEAREVE